MLLRELTRYYSQNHKVMPLFGWELHPLRWVIVVNSNGGFCDIEDQATAKNPNGVMTYVPRKVVRTRNIRSFQCWDHSGYVLGVDSEDPERAKRIHESFIHRCRLIADETGDSGAESVALFVENLSEQSVNKHPLYEELLESGAISFRLETDDILVFNRPAVYQWLSNNPLTSGTKRGQCMVCGKWGNIERILPTIKGIRGCNPIGVRLTAINNGRSGNSSLGAYGLEQGFCAPTCEQCAYRYGNALNYLLHPNSRNSIFIGQFTFAFWCPQGHQLELLVRKVILGGRDTQQVKDKNGNMYLKPDPRKLYWVPEPSRNVIRKLKQQYKNGYVNIVVFRGKDRRAAIELYQRIPQTELIDNLCYWLTHTGKPNKELIPLSTFLSALSLGKDLNYLRSSVLLSFLRALLSRKGINLAIIKSLVGYSGYNSTTPSLHEKLICFMSSMQPEDHKSSNAYLCGQLIALLVKCQEEANGEATSIICNPAIVMAPARKLASYLRKNRHHLNLIGKQNFGRRVNLEKKIQSLVSRIDSFPEFLEVDEQLSLLSGYYCQRQLLFSVKKREKNVV